MRNDLSLTTTERQHELLAWGRASLRDLPWRETRDPWSIWVAETMLQQTQVDRVVPRYRRFLGRFETVACCAAAPRSAVIEELSLIHI